MYVLTPASNLVDLALSQATGIDVLVLVTAQSCFYVAHELAIYLGLERVLTSYVQLISSTC